MPEVFTAPLAQAPRAEEAAPASDAIPYYEGIMADEPNALVRSFAAQPVLPGGVGESVEQGGWFMWFRIIQVSLIGLIALAVYLLTEGLAGRAVMVSRWAIGVFAVFFSAYDVAAGIATGYALRNAQGLSAEGQATVYEAVKDMPLLSPIFGLSIVGTGGWVVALIAAATALRRAGASRGPFVLLILAGVLLMGGHPFAAGTLAFGCFFLATAWLELAPGRLTSASEPSRA
jgi:hypothetical protein